MKNLYLIILLAMLGLGACKSEKKVEAISEKIAVQAFSDTTKLDTFKITLSGKNTEQMLLNFTIKNANGAEIYRKVIKASDLLKSFLAGEDLKKESAKVAFINEQINVFFTEEHFLVPAITENQELDNYTPDKDFYMELKKTKLNGFYYSLGKDKSIYIAWSVNEKKVKVYYQCC